ncbi:hypothetical protein V6N11_062530 [Hibiscus sabdariffa]|uniref:Uncharacterized protein n=1 Tax=Hibiscus sabdariffa TaxID=183260 RepID=A0ABR2PSV9_9ROSI
MLRFLMIKDWKRKTVHGSVQGEVGERKVQRPTGESMATRSNTGKRKKMEKTETEPHSLVGVGGGWPDKSCATSHGLEAFSLVPLACLPALPSHVLITSHTHIIIVV